MNVHFALNVPQHIALSDPTGEYDPRTEEVSYPTTDGRILTLPYKAAEKLNALYLKPAERFCLCKRWEGIKGTIPQFDFWLAPASEKARAAEESVPTEPLEHAMPLATKESTQPPPAVPPQRRRSKVEQMPKPDAPPIQPSFWDGRATGTYGPQPRPAIAAQSRPPRIPYNVAFREVVQFVTSGLKEAGEQWSDAAKQDMISTVLISASQQGLLSLWER